MRCIIFDLEATGLHPEKGDTIIDVAAVRVGPDGIEDRFQSLVHPGTATISPFIEALTGISNAMVADAPSWEDVRGQLATFLGEDLPLVGHNVGFDCNFLREYGIDVSAEREVDSCDFATVYFPKAPSHSLEVLTNYLQIEHTEKHRAMGDVLATYELLRCLVGARNTATPKLQEAVKLLQEKAPQWPGTAFFTLDVPVLQAEERSTSTKDFPVSSLDKMGVHAVQLQPSVKRTIQWVQKQTPAPLVLVAPSQAESVRDVVLTEETGMYLDKVEQYLHPEKCAAFLEQATWTHEEALLGFRLSALAEPGKYIHMNSLALSHKERGILSSFAASDGDVVEIMKQSSDCPLYMTYAAWLTHHASLPQNRLWIVADAMRMELHLFQTAKSYLSMDALLGRLRALQGRCASTGMNADDLFETGEHIVRYTFGGLSKLLAHDQREMTLQDTPELLLQFAQSWQTLLSQWRVRVQGHDALLAYVETIEKTVQDFLAGFDDANKRSVLSRMSQGIILQQELGSLAFAREWFQQVPQCYLLHGYRDPAFPLFLSPETSTVVDELHLRQCTLQRMRSEQITGEFALTPTQAVDAILRDSEKKVLYATGGGTALDKAFESLYDGHHGEKTSVLSSGKTGGRGKVRYGFRNASRAIVVATTQDILGLDVQGDILVCSSLPFPPVMGPYWTKFGENTFQTLTIPLLTQLLIDTAWAVSGDALDIYVTDTRTFEKRYGQEILATLAQYMKVE